VRMAEDVRSIAMREIERIDKQLNKPGASILSGARHPNKPTIASKPMEKKIASDISDDRGLKHIGLIHSKPGDKKVK